MLGSDTDFRERTWNAQELYNNQSPSWKKTLGGGYHCTHWHTGGARRGVMTDWPGEESLSLYKGNACWVRASRRLCGSASEATDGDLMRRTVLLVCHRWRENPGCKGWGVNVNKVQTRWVDTQTLSSLEIIMWRMSIGVYELVYGHHRKSQWTERPNDGGQEGWLRQRVRNLI